jgi:thiol-disulfide isomerase/thioredoxin
MTKKIILLLLVFLLTNAARTQVQKIELKPLQKGDTIPNLPITFRIGDSIYNAHLRDYKGKLLLLDFWGVHCLSCIASMPDMLELQNKFKDQMQILFVTKDKTEEVNALYKKYDNGSKPSKWIEASKHLSFINGDSIFKVLFPTKVQPTHIWIDSNQIVYSIAYSTTTTTETVKAFLEGKKISLAEQKFVNLDIENPLSWFDQNESSNLQYYSFIANHIENGGAEGKMNVKTDTNTKRILGFTCLNSPIVDLYKLAYKEWMPASIPDNRIIVETENREKFFPAKSDDKFDHQLWWDDHVFCYGLKVPPSQSGQVYKIMQQDLDRFFNLKSKIEKLNVKCIVLKAVAIEKFKSKMPANKPEQKFDENRKLLILNNVDMGFLFSYYLGNNIQIQKSSLPFLNETNYTGKINIQLFWPSYKDWNVSISILRKSLQKFGLDLVEEYRKMDMLVIKDNN